MVINEETIIDYNGINFTIILEEFPVSNVNIIDNPEYTDIIQVKQYYDDKNQIIDRKSIKVGENVHHNYSTEVYYSDKKIVLQGKHNIPDDCHVKTFKLKLDNDITFGGCTIPQINYKSGIYLPSQFITTKVLGGIKISEKAIMQPLGTNAKGNQVYLMGTVVKEHKPEEKKITRLRVYNLIFIVIIPLLYFFLSTHTISPRDQIIIDFFSKIKLPFSNLKESLLHYCYVLIPIVIINKIAIRNNKKALIYKDKLNKEKTRQEEEINKIELENKQILRKLCISKYDYSDNLVKTFLEIQ